MYVFSFEHEFSFESYLKGFVPLAERTFCYDPVAIFSCVIHWSGDPLAINVDVIN